MKKKKREEMSAAEILATDLEHFETPAWTVDAILEKEVMTHAVVDPCCGAGILSIKAAHRGHDVFSLDIHNWGFNCWIGDFLDPEMRWKEQLEFNTMNGTVLMNPPFSKAEEFVKRAFELGASKVICFQRFAWWESRTRKQFWDKYPPQRVYICGDRATCWRHDIPKEERTSGTATAHAWFVWEKNQAAGTMLDRIYKGEGK